MKYFSLLKKISPHTGLIFLFLLLWIPGQSQTLDIIPRPLSVKQTSGEKPFVISRNTIINIPEIDPYYQKAAIYFQSLVREKKGIELKIVYSEEITSDQIVINVDESIVNNEGYKLSVTKEVIQVNVRWAPGAFYAFQTIRQMLGPQFENPLAEKHDGLRVPACVIHDSPQFSYRGMHLDVCRHFFPVEFIKKYIDLLAYHKFNTFHWHLTEDQGWRIEIKKYPRLTEIGSMRNETLIGHAGTSPKRFDQTPYGGFYTQEQIREIVAYANARFIRVIPEIEMPGHALAAIAAYPSLSCSGRPQEVATEWGVFDDVYCAGKEETFTFIEDVLTEVCALFPSEYIHIGGDECPKARWEKCPKCQERMKAEGLADEHELQSYFVQRVEKFLTAKGKKLIGWDEILEGGLPPNATVMSWRGTSGGIAAATQNHDVIMTPGTHCYFDHYQAPIEKEPLAIGGNTTVKKVYSFNPIPTELTPEQAKYIIGAQANVWTEYISTPEHVEYMAYPRACALAEVLWTAPENKAYDNFLSRFKMHAQRLKMMNVNFAPHLTDAE